MNKEQEAGKKNIRNNPLYSNTPYDDAFRTMESECDDLLIPLVNFFFHEDYGEGTEVIRLRNEHFVEGHDGSNRRRISDSHFGMRYRGKSKWYHMECESGKYDGTVLVRMFEYESQIALDESIRGRTKLVLNFPYAGILLLRGGDRDPYSQGED